MTSRLRDHLFGLTAGALLLLPVLAAAAPKAPKPDLNRGKSLFKVGGCAGCHKIGNEGGTMGPDLTHVGKTLKAADIRKKIENPKYNMPNSIMPAASAIELSKADVTNLTAYLASLK